MGFASSLGRGDARSAAATALDPENLRIAFGLAELAQGFYPVRLKPGVYKYASWDELLAAWAKRKEGHLRVGRPAGT